jgi:hypothetical protein
VVASVDTYLRFAEAVNRLDLSQTEVAGLKELRGGGSEEKGKGAIEGIKEGIRGNGKKREKQRSSRG